MVNNDQMAIGKARARLAMAKVGSPEHTKAKQFLKKVESPNFKKKDARLLKTSRLRTASPSKTDEYLSDLSETEDSLESTDGEERVFSPKTKTLQVTPTKNLRFEDEGLAKTVALRKPTPHPKKVKVSHHSPGVASVELEDDKKAEDDEKAERKVLEDKKADEPEKLCVFELNANGLQINFDTSTWEKYSFQILTVVALVLYHFVCSFMFGRK